MHKPYSLNFSLMKKRKDSSLLFTSVESGSNPEPEPCMWIGFFLSIPACVGFPKVVFLYTVFCLTIFLLSKNRKRTGQRLYMWQGSLAVTLWQANFILRWAIVCSMTLNKGSFRHRGNRCTFEGPLGFYYQKEIKIIITITIKSRPWTLPWFPRSQSSETSVQYGWYSSHTSCMLSRVTTYDALNRSNMRLTDFLMADKSLTSFGEKQKLTYFLTTSGNLPLNRSLQD